MSYKQNNTQETNDIENPILDQENMPKLETPKKISWVKVSLIVITSLLLIAGATLAINIAIKPKTTLAVKTLKTKITKIDPTSESESESTFATYISGDKPRFPFTLKLSLTDVMKPHWIYAPFNEGSYKTVPGNQYTYTSMIFQTNCERSLEGGIDLDFADSAIGRLIGSALNLLEISLDFKEFQRNQTFKEIVWLNVQKEIIEVDPSNITLSKYFEDQLKEILLNEEKTKEEKTQLLIEKFIDYGYYIPMFVGMGGKFAFIYEETSKESAEAVAAAIKLDLEILASGGSIGQSKNLSSYTSNLRITYYGGENILITEADSYEKVEEWMHSITQNNYLPLNYDVYSPFAPISDFFPKDLKELYKDYKDDVDLKFKVLYDKYQLLNEFVGAHVPEHEVNTTQRAYIYGALPEYSPYIKTYTEDYYKEKTCIGRFEELYSKGFSSTQKILGFKIDQHKPDLQAGYFTLVENPLISSTFQVKFRSGIFCASMDYTIEIYYIDWETLD